MGTAHHSNYLHSHGHLFPEWLFLLHWLDQHLLINSSVQQMHVYQACVPVTVTGGGDTMVNQTKVFPFLMELTFPERFHTRLNITAFPDIYPPFADVCPLLFTHPVSKVLSFCP